MSTVQEFPHITEEAVAALRKMLNVEYPTRGQFNEYATPDTIRHFAMGSGDGNPLFADEEYGRKSPWGAMVAPPTFLFSCLGQGAVQGLPGVHAMWSGIDVECFLPLRAGDRVKMSVYLSALTPKQSKFSGRSLLQEHTYPCRNQFGQLVANFKEWAIRTERDTAKEKGKYNYLELARYSPEDIARIEKTYGQEVVRGAEPRYWEDVQEGEELPPTVHGPLVATECIAFKIGWGFRPFAFAGRVAWEYRKKHPGVAITNEMGVPDVPERVHWDSDFARRVGVPAAYDYGPQRTSWGLHPVTNWIGDDAFIKRYRSECRRFNLMGDTHLCAGRVTRKWQEGEEFLVQVETWARDQRNEATQYGFAVASLPSRRGFSPARHYSAKVGRGT